MFWIELYIYFLNDFGYHWTDYARCLEPQEYQCVIPQQELNILNFLIDKANEGNPCYENRYFEAKPIDYNICPNLRG